MSANSQETQNILIDGSALEQMQFIYQAKDGIFAETPVYQETSATLPLSNGKLFMFNHDYNRPQANPRGIDGVIITCNYNDATSLEKTTEALKRYPYETMGENVEVMLAITSTDNQKSLLNSPEYEGIANEIKSLESDKLILVTNVNLTDRDSVLAALKKLSAAINPQLSQAGTLAKQGLFGDASGHLPEKNEKAPKCSIM